MVVTKNVTQKLEQIAMTLVGKVARFEVITAANIADLKQGDLILSSSGILDYNVFDVDVSTFISSYKEKDDEFQFVLKRKGRLLFQNDWLIAYKPYAVEHEEKAKNALNLIHRRVWQPESEVDLQYIETIEELIRHKVMLKMIYI